jgi:hypothetical protein
VLFVVSMLFLHVNFMSFMIFMVDVLAFSNLKKLQASGKPALDMVR